MSEPLAGPLDARFPNITKACWEITLDNGGLHRDRPEARIHKARAAFLMARPYYDLLPEIDRWLGDLSPEDFETVCIGEASEAEALLAPAPPFTETLLNEYFDEVC